MKAKLVKKSENHYDLYVDGVGLYTSTSQWTSNGNLLSLKNCQAIERGYDLDELADEYIVVKPKYREHEHNMSVDAFKAGFQKALELMSDKKFSEEDVMLGWDAGVMSQSICFTNYFGLKRESELKSHRESYQGNLKPSALQQTEWDVKIEIRRVKDETKIVGAVKGVKGSGNKITTYKSVPKLDATGCLILKLKSE